MGFGVRILVSILVVFLLLQTLNATSSSSVLRRPLARNKNRQIPPNCTHLVSESQCSHNPQCRWCKSQSLDDTCFTRSEAWRLPLQTADGYHFPVDHGITSISNPLDLVHDYCIKKLFEAAVICRRVLADAQDKGYTGGTTSDGE
nr:hypothetical protein CFP56_57522 [Quercus suber]